MQLFKSIQQIEYLDSLIRKGATGTPQELAQKMHVSERQVYRIIDELRLIGFPIAYSKVRNRYYYADEVKLNIELTIKGTKVLNIKGQ
jgi:predicted DNA-binding transcriptional regulator YafY